jgi:hypothetical protein
MDILSPFMRLRWPTMAVAAVHQPSRSIPLGALERLPLWLIRLVIGLQWLWLACRYRSLNLPSAVNPGITSGGLIGEGKLEYFQAMGPLARARTATFIALTNRLGMTDDELGQRLAAAGLAFPLMVKPDLGLCGYGVRKVDTLADLQTYLGGFPRDEVVVVQRYLTDEGEAGIFYTRDRATTRGRIIGLALRHYPRVSGDGVHTLRQLIERDPRARRLLTTLHECPRELQRIPASGEDVRVATIGSYRVGGLYRQGDHLITPALTAAIEAIAQDMPGFHGGRFDVRFHAREDFLTKAEFTIIEVNGAGSEAINAWDPDLPLRTSLGMIFSKQRILFALGAAQRRAGNAPIGILALARLYFRQQRLIPRYPPSN